MAATASTRNPNPNNRPVWLVFCGIVVLTGDSDDLAGAQLEYIVAKKETTSTVSSPVLRAVQIQYQVYDSIMRRDRVVQLIAFKSGYSHLH